MPSTLPPKSEIAYDPTLAVRAIRSVPRTRLVDYRDYWKYLTKTETPDTVYRRWVYAYASVNANVSCHLSCFRFFLRYPRGFAADMSERQFVARVRQAGVGGQFEVRGGGVHRFDQLFAADCGRWAPKTPTPKLRDDLAADLYGLGRAKTAFALELVAPLTSTAVCLDRHILRLYGVPKNTSGAKVSDDFYEEAETHWVHECRKRGFPSMVVRAAYWDMRFKMPNCRWWSFVFEPAFDSVVWAMSHGKTKW